MAPSDDYMPDGCSAEVWVQNSRAIDARELREQTLLQESSNGTFHAGPLNAIPEEYGASGEPMLIGNSEANEPGVADRDFRPQCSAAFSVMGDTLPLGSAGLDPDDDELLPTEGGMGMRIANIGRGAGVSTRFSSRSGSSEGWLGILVQAAARGISPQEARGLLLGLPEALTGQLRCSQLRYASLMAGVGGRSMGYRLDSVGNWEGVAVEWNASFAAVHNANNPYDYCFEHKMTVEAPLPEGFPLGRACHHMAAGPPCQPYSRAGKGLGARDERDGIPAVLKAIAILHPTIVEIENVPTLTRFTDVVQDVWSTLESLGYHVTSYQLNAADYGVPQRRVRLLIVGSLLGPLEAPPPVEGPVVTVRDAIGEGSGFDAFRAYDAQLELTEDQKMRAERLDIMAGCVNFRELHPDEPARTLTASNLANNHGLMLRLRMEDGVTLQRPSVEQAAALQSFPIDFKFPETLISRRQAYIAVGNAMPTQLGLHLTRAARQQLHKAQDAYWTLVEIAESERGGLEASGAEGEPASGSVDLTSSTQHEGRASDSVGEWLVKRNARYELRASAFVERVSDLSAPEGGASLAAVGESENENQNAEPEAAPARSETVRIFTEWLLTMAAVSGPDYLEYGPGDKATADYVKFQHRKRLEARGRAQGNADTIASLGGGADELSCSGPLVGATVRDHKVVAGCDRTNRKLALMMAGVGYQTMHGGLVRTFTNALCDTGAALGALDIKTFKQMRKEGAVGSVVSWADRQETLNAFEGTQVTSLGHADITIAVRDKLSQEWFQYVTRVRLVRSQDPLLILGIPFLAEAKGQIDVSSGDVSLVHGDSLIVAECISSRDDVKRLSISSCERAQETLRSVSNPYVFSTKEYTVPGWGGLGIRVQVPHTLEGETVHLLPLPDAETKLFANRRGLRLHGSSVQVVDPDGYITVRINNLSSKAVKLPAFTPVGQYCLDPELAPAADMSVDEIMAALKVEGVSADEQEAVQKKVREALFADRQSRRSYFTQSRVGKGVGVPEAVLKLTEEFKRSGKPPPSVPPRPLSSEQREAQNKHKDELIRQGHMIPSSSPFGAVVTMVRKPKGGWRMAYDYRETNAILEKQHYTLKSTRECLDLLGKSKWLTALDMVSAFWQTPLAPESRQYTAVNFESGQKLEMTTLPMGLQAASAVFQKNMDILLVGLQPDVAISFIDDVLIYGGDTLEEHLINVVKVLDRIGGCGYTLRAEKCIIAARTADFLGFKIQDGTARPDDSKVAQVRDMQFPLAHEDLKKFNGLIQWCSPHIPDCALKLGPLQDRANDSSRNNTPASEEEMAAFESIKTWLTDPTGPILRLPDFDKPFYLLCDAASTVGCSVVLVQKDKDGHEHPVAYYSKRWTEAESRWHSLEHECATIYEGIKRFAHYLHDKFYVITDAEPLVWLRSMKHPKGKYATWTMEFNCYDFEVHHRPGKDHWWADSFSRLAKLMPESRPGCLIGELMEGRPVEHLLQDSDVATAGSAEPTAATVAALAPFDWTIGATGAAYSAEVFKRKRVAVSLFTSSHLLAYEYEEGLQLPAAAKEHKRESLNEAATRALTPFVGSREVALQVIGPSTYILPSGGTRYLVVPSFQLPMEVTDTGKCSKKVARWIDLTDASLDVYALPWRERSDADMARRIQLLLHSMHTGCPHTPHLALRAACAQVLRRALTSPAQKVAAVQSTHAGADGDGSPMTALWEALDARAEEIVSAGRLPDGRLIPRSEISRPDEALAALAEIERVIERRKEQQEVVVMGIDFEYCAMRKGQRAKLSYMQVAIGPGLYVFDVLRLPFILGMDHVGKHVSTMAKWLRDATVFKIAHACASDVKLLSDCGVAVESVFDTAVADALLRSHTVLRKLNAVVEEYTGADMPMKDDFTSQMHAVVWVRRPLPQFALVYAWQDVVHLERLFEEQEQRLSAAGLLSVAWEMSRHVAQRDEALVSPAVKALGLVIRCENDVLLEWCPVRATQDVVSFALPTAYPLEPVPLKAKETHGVLRAAVHRLLSGEDTPVPAAFNRIRLATSKIRAVRGKHYIDLDFADEDAIRDSISENFVFVPWKAAVELCMGESDRRALLRARYLELVKGGGAPALAAVSVGRPVRSVFPHDAARALAAGTLELNRELAELMTADESAELQPPRPAPPCVNRAALTAVEATRRMQSTAKAGRVQPPKAGATVEVGKVAMISPADFHARAKDLGEGLCIHEDPSAPVGLRRGAALRSLSDNGNLPALRTVCTGLVRRMREPLPKAQKQYALEMGRTGFCLCAHPLYNQWSLINEPVAGAKANCVVRMQDVHIAVPPSCLNNDDGQSGGSAGARHRERAAKAAANQKLMVKEACLTVALVVQVEATGSDGVLTLHYGNGFDRTWEVGEPAKDSSLEMDVVGFARRVLSSGEREASDEEVFRALLRCGAPRDGFTARLAEQERRRAAGPRQPLVNRLHGPSMEGRATIPSRSELTGDTTAVQVVAEPQDGTCIQRAIDLDELAQGATTGEATAVPGSTTDQPIDQGVGGEDGDSRDRPIVVGAVQPAPSQMAAIREEDCSFVGVVVHDGTNALYFNTSKPVAMGNLTPTLACIVTKTTTELKGVHAAWAVLRIKLGAVWEHRQLRMKHSDFQLVGASCRGKHWTAWYSLRSKVPLGEIESELNACFAGRRPAPEAGATFTSLAIKKPSSVDSETVEAKAIVSVVTGKHDALRQVKPSTTSIPSIMRADDIWRCDPAYQQGVELSHRSLAFRDIATDDATVAAFGSTLIEPEDDVDAEPRRNATTRAEVTSMMRNEPDLSAGEFIGDEKAKGEVTSTDHDVSEVETGREACYMEHALHPHTDDPAAFITRLRPCGLPSDIAKRLREAQDEDPYCKRVRSRLAEYEAGRQSTTDADGIQMPPHVIDGAAGKPAGDGDRRWAAKRARRYLEQLRKTSDEFRVDEDGVLYHLGESRSGLACLERVVPLALRDVMIRQAHDGMVHLGRRRTLDALRSGQLWWPSMAEDVKAFCRNCDTCAFNKLGPHHGAMRIPPNGNRPWQVVCVDVVHLAETASGMSKAVIFGDRFGRGVRAFAVPKGLTSEMFLNIVAFGLVPDVGLPAMMISDRGSNLISKLVDVFYDKFGIEPRRTDAHMHTGVGLVERFNASLRDMARAAYFDTKVEWDLYLPYLVMFYNATVQESTGFSPFFIEHGREPVLPWHDPSAVLEESLSLPEFVSKHLLGLGLAWEAMQSHVQDVEERRKSEHDGKYQTNLRFSPNDRVLLLQPGRVSKMDMPYVGPYRVLQGPDERDRYVLRDLHGRRVHSEFHVSKLKHWPIDNDLGEEYYIVDSIVDAKGQGDERRYRVRWRGWSAEHDTWEPLSNLNELSRAEALLYDAKHAPSPSGEGTRVAGPSRGRPASKRNVISDKEPERVSQASTSASEERERRRLAREEAKELRLNKP